MKSFHVLLAVGLLALGGDSAVAERTLTVDDILGVRQLRDVRLSPVPLDVATNGDTARKNACATKAKAAGYRG